MSSTYVGTVGPFSDALRELELLEPEQFDQLPALAAASPASRDLARLLVRRGWLSAYQANQILQGKASLLVIGQYVLIDRIGEGGMGEVFKSRHRRLHKLAAVKIVRPSRAGIAIVRERFLREAEAAAQLSHPNIVAVFDAGEEDGQLYLAMEYIDGIDLGRMIKQFGPLPVPLAVDFMRQAALGLHHAHTLGFVHRDIKPQNLLVAPRGGLGKGNFEQFAGAAVKVLDLGLVRLQPERVEQTALALTQQGVVIGTMDYVAPEQARNAHHVDFRADLYALGCTFYHLLAGDPPFPGGSAIDKLLRHQDGIAAPLRPRRPDMLPALERVIARMMAKRPEDRPRSALALVEELAAIASGAPLAQPVLVGPSTLDIAEGYSLEPTRAMPLPADAPLALTVEEPVPETLKPASRSLWWWGVGAVCAAVVALAVAATLLLSAPRPQKAIPEQQTKDEKPAPPDLAGFIVPGSQAVLGVKPAALARAIVLRPPGNKARFVLPLGSGQMALLRSLKANYPDDVEEARFYFPSPRLGEATWVLRGKFKPTSFAWEKYASGGRTLWRQHKKPGAFHLSVSGDHLFAAQDARLVEPCLRFAEGGAVEKPSADMQAAFSVARRDLPLWFALAPEQFGTPPLRPGDPLTPVIKAILTEGKVVSGDVAAGDRLTVSLRVRCRNEAGAETVEEALRGLTALAPLRTVYTSNHRYLDTLLVKAASNAQISRTRQVVALVAEVDN
jgi:serine/threonine-protein kinase